jgi:hypothetical protein
MDKRNKKPFDHPILNCYTIIIGGGKMKDYSIISYIVFGIILGLTLGSILTIFTWQYWVLTLFIWARDPILEFIDYLFSRK